MLCFFSSGSKTFRLNLLFAQVDVFEAAERYQKEGIPLIILAGKDYGSGNSRDWVAKGPYLLVNLTFFFLFMWCLPICTLPSFLSFFDIRVFLSDRAYVRSLPKVSRSCTRTSWWAWASYRFSSCPSRTPILWSSAGKRSSPSRCLRAWVPGSSSQWRYETSSNRV